MNKLQLTPIENLEIGDIVTVILSNNALVHGFTIAIYHKTIAIGLPKHDDFGFKINCGIMRNPNYIVNESKCFSEPRIIMLIKKTNILPGIHDQLLELLELQADV